MPELDREWHDEELEYPEDWHADLTGEEVEDMEMAKGVDLTPDSEVEPDLPEPGPRHGDLASRKKEGWEFDVKMDNREFEKLKARPESWKKHRRAQPREFTKPRELRVMEDTEVVLDGKKYLLEKGDRITIL